MNKKTFVLVHGAYHGGWCWRDVAASLRAQGHTVFTPTLTGLGERADLLAVNPDLNTHIGDVIQVIANEEIGDVILVGHSYAGIVVSGVADRIPESIAHLVYLDAVILQPGASMLELVSAETIEYYRSLLPENGCGGVIPPPPAEFFGISDPQQVAWLNRRLTPQPLATYFNKVELHNPLGNNLAVTYIAGTHPYFRPTEASRNFAKNKQKWKYIEIDASHDAMISAPEKLAALLAQI
jgi:pimeloyl-ACP methyl ester carboxylesterase